MCVACMANSLCTHLLALFVKKVDTVKDIDSVLNFPVLSILYILILEINFQVTVLF